MRAAEAPTANPIATPPSIALANIERRRA
jgi:hypothetical protein